jgi:HEAT repeats
MFGQVSYADPSIASALLTLVLLLSLVFSLLISVWVPATKRPDPRPTPVRPRERLLAFPSVDFVGKYRVRKVDRRLYHWLTSLVCETEVGDPSAESHRPLLEFRGDFRAITRLHPIGGLVACLGSPHRDLRRLAIYLLGRSSRGATVSAVKALRDDPDPRVRREVAKALARMAEWTELQAMTLHDDDPRVRCQASILSNTTRRPYSDRLKLALHVYGRMYEPSPFRSHMPLFMLEPIGAGKAAKTREWIRRILEHIRKLVRASVRDQAARRLDQ